MLYFFCARKDDLSHIAREGIVGPVNLLTSLEDAVAACVERILVVNAYALAAPGEGFPNQGEVESNFIPPSAIVNIEPYYPPRAIVAAGGIVTRQEGSGEPEVLMIYRNGLWDLPKGKLEAGESIPQCAMREVREEVGIKDLVVIQGLGATVHGYVRNERYSVKTTYWYQMTTRQETFTAQAEEGIEQVAWKPWGEAVDRVGFESARRHLVWSRPLLRF
ncbi:MAG: NUDIX hydrolase [Rhodothermales bacterium]|nr:NUDIX hydrolase [Rhodothermales bacterium]